jgi:hypothetical protein
MNEQIGKLISEAIKAIPDHVDFDLPKEFTEKFAELIVRECAKFLDENSGYDDANNAWHPEPEDMLKHFGVEL